MPDEIKGTELKREKSKLSPEQEEKIAKARVAADLLRVEIDKQRQQATAAAKDARAKAAAKAEAAKKAAAEKAG